MAVGDYEKIETARRAAWKQMQRSPWGSDEHRAREREYAEVVARREGYLRELLAQLPFRSYVAHAYTARETATYGGADHIVVAEPIRIGKLSRQPGDALSRPRAKFLDLSRVEEDRLPTSVADIRIAERIVAGRTSAAKKTAAQLDAEIEDALRRH